MVQVANYLSVVGGVFNLCPSKKKEEDHVILNSDLEKLTLSSVNVVVVRLSFSL